MQNFKPFCFSMRDPSPSYSLAKDMPESEIKEQLEHFFARCAAK